MSLMGTKHVLLATLICLMGNSLSNPVCGNLELPVFHSKDELKHNPWGKYLQAVYGEASQFSFPLDISSFNYFYRDILPHVAGLHVKKVKPGSHANRDKQVEVTAGDCLDAVDRTHDPSLAFHHEGILGFMKLDSHAQPAIKNLWVYKYPHAKCRTNSWPHVSFVDNTTLPDPVFEHSSGFPDNSDVEVVHTCCSEDHKTGVGFWGYLAIGSGLYMNLGKTQIFSDHPDAAKAVGLPTNSVDFSELVKRGRAKGWDTIQFTHRCEATYKYEIMDLRPTSEPAMNSACPGVTTSFKAGWQAERPCTCDPSGNLCLNCATNGKAFPMCQFEFRRPSPAALVADTGVEAKMITGDQLGSGTASIIDADVLVPES